MLVSQVENMDTHAVIGGSDVQSFGISNNAEFYTLLSDSLYSDKIMAVVREIMCNAWDAHLIAGKKDIPLEITQSNNRLTIRDFGTGIPNDQIKPIYCIYGESTKTKSKLETGGFGLGSKAPFAYTEHFTVSNWHNGTKTVYAISRGSVETQGKPDIRTIVSVPDDDIGIEVSIPIKEKDTQRFNELIRYIAHFGGMNVKFQDEQLDSINYDEMKENFIIIPRPKGIESSSNIFLKYGSVVYPVLSKDEYNTKYIAIENIIKNKTVTYGYNHNSNIIVFKADPNTITVTPSRESLEYSQITLNTLTSIINSFESKISKYIESSFQDLVKTQCDYCFKEDHYNAIFDSLTNAKFKRSLPCFKEFESMRLSSYEDLGKYIALYSMDQKYLEKHYKTIVNTFLNYLLKNDPKHTDTYRAIRKYLNKNQNISSSYYYHVKAITHIINRYIIHYFKELLPNDQYAIKVLKSSYDRRTRLISATEFNNNTISELILINEVILAKSLYAAQETNDVTGQLVIKSNVTKKSIESIKTAMFDCKYTVIDSMDIVQKREYSSSEDDTPSSKKPKGFVRLSDCLSKTTEKKYFRSSALDDESTYERILEPKHIVYQKSNNGNYFINNWGNDNFDLLLDRYPDTVVLRNEVSYDSWIKKGAVDTASLVTQEVKDYIEKKGEKFLNKLDLSNFMIERSWNNCASNIIELIVSSKKLQNKLKIKPIRNQKEKLYADFLYNLYKKHCNFSYFITDYFDSFKDYFANLHIKAKNDILLQSIKSSSLLSLVNDYKLIRSINNPKSENYDTAIKLLNILIKEL